MISRRSFLTHLLAAVVLVPLLGADHADAAKKAAGSAKRSTKRRRSARRPRNRRRTYAARHAPRPVSRPVSRPAYVRQAPRNRLEEGWPFGWMDPRWSTSSGDPFFDPRWN